MSLAIVGTCLISCYQGSVDIINEQLSVRNSLDALCYQSNCMNWVFSPELASVCLGTGHKMAIISRCRRL